MFEWEGKQYELKFSLERLGYIEESLGKPIMSIYAFNGGAFAINEMLKIFTISLKEIGSDYFCNNKEAKRIFEGYIQQENGYKSINEMIAKKLMEDCPFLFPTAI